MWHQFDPLSVFLLSGPLIFLLIIWLARLGFGQEYEPEPELTAQEGRWHQSNFYPVHALDEDHEKYNASELRFEDGVRDIS